MTPRLPALKGRTIVAALTRLGFEEVRRSSGSHIQMAHPDGRRTTIPDHGNTDIGRGLMRKILRDIEITPDEFSKLL